MTTIISAETARDKYPRVAGIKTPGGSPIRDCGDTVAVALRQTGMSDWLSIADQNDCRAQIDALIANGKNVGQVRMALGRILRAKLERHNKDPEKNPAPVLPEPLPMPVKAAADPKPPLDEGDVDDSDDEVAEDEEDEEDAA